MLLHQAHLLMCVCAGVPSDSDPSSLSNKLSGQSSVKPSRPSLAKILLSLDGNLAKQQALSHVLSALQIMYARCCTVPEPGVHQISSHQVYIFKHYLTLLSLCVGML